MVRALFCLAASSGFIAVALGAFVAHRLQDQLSASLLQAFATANRYHFYHTITLLVIALLASRSSDNQPLLWAGVLMAGGTLLFSGSLYLIALTGARWLGPITPIGGVLLLLAWLVLAYGTFKAV
jgi:uncharacterized membrane protein YgdD (TMEM256/DUF423 family)